DVGADGDVAVEDVDMPVAEPDRVRGTVDLYAPEAHPARVLEIEAVEGHRLAGGGRQRHPAAARGALDDEPGVAAAADEDGRAGGRGPDRPGEAAPRRARVGGRRRVAVVAARAGHGVLVDVEGSRRARVRGGGALRRGRRSLGVAAAP